MWSLTLAFGPANTIWAFLFKTREAADNANAQISAARSEARGTLKLGGTAYNEVKIADDFGQRAELDPMQIHARTVEDLDLQAEAHNHRNLALARGAAKLEEMAKADPDPALQRQMARIKQQQALQRFQMGGPGPVPMA